MQSKTSLSPCFEERCASQEDQARLHQRTKIHRAQAQSRASPATDPPVQHESVSSMSVSALVQSVCRVNVAATTRLRTVKDRAHVTCTTVVVAELLDQTVKLASARLLPLHLGQGVILPLHRALWGVLLTLNKWQEFWKNTFRAVFLG